MIELLHSNVKIIPEYEQVKINISKEIAPLKKILNANDLQLVLNISDLSSNTL